MLFFFHPWIEVKLVIGTKHRKTISVMAPLASYCSKCSVRTIKKGQMRTESPDMGAEN